MPKAQPANGRGLGKLLRFASQFTKPVIASLCLKENTISLYIGDEMAECDYCGKDILFGGVSEYDLRFCNKKCRENGNALVLYRSEIPQDIVHKQAQKVHQGLCPKCQGNGPVDVHTSYRICSAIFLTSWRTTPNICCRSCGVKSQIRDCIFSFFLGWWSPYGLFITPVQVIKNISGILKGQDELNPSEKLENLIRGTIAQQMMEEHQTET